MYVYIYICMYVCTLSRRQSIPLNGAPTYMKPPCGERMRARFGGRALTWSVCNMPTTKFSTTGLSGLCLGRPIYIVKVSG